MRASKCASMSSWTFTKRPLGNAISMMPDRRRGGASCRDTASRPATHLAHSRQRTLTLHLGLDPCRVLWLISVFARSAKIGAGRPRRQ